MDVMIRDSALMAMRAAAAACQPLEACGLLLGQGATIELAVPARNVAADSARHFEIDPVALVAAHRAARGGGPQVLGWFHSHPTGVARPSATDAAMALHDGRVWAIVGDVVAFWRDGPSGFEPLSYDVVQG